MDSEPTSIPQPIAGRQNLENTAWRWMRYSGLLLIPLAFGHVLLQDVWVGVHQISINYVAVRWESIGWRAYDAFLLIFAFAHGINGLRQVAGEYVKSENIRIWIGRGLLAFWALISLIGSIALIGGVRPMP